MTPVIAGTKGDAAPGVAIVGAGPAGLTAAYELVRRGTRVSVFEQASQVGGISRTEVRDGYRFDIGGHRFFTKVDEVNHLWQELLGEQFVQVPRMSRIYYGGKFYDYPLNALPTLWKLGLLESGRILLSYLKAKLRPIRPEDTFEQWVVNRFGRRLYETFFKTYTEKVWGIPCDRIDAAWAAQRIKGLSLRAAVMNAVFGAGDAKSLITHFNYPRHGPGQMWERFHEAVVARGGEVRLGTDVAAVRHDGRGRVTGIDIASGNDTRSLPVSHVISSMPITTLLHRLDPEPPDHVLAAAAKLKYRDFVLVGLIVNRRELFPDNWIYVHAPGVRVGRIQNFKNWSPHMVPDAGKTSLGMEYFCTRGDDLWEMSDERLVALARREIETLGLAAGGDVEGGVVIRQPKAYPVYDAEYTKHLAVIRGYLDGFANLQTIGRNGMHRYNNQDHSMLAGLLAARNVLGERHDLWDINTERSYHEQRDSRPMAIRDGRSPVAAGAVARCASAAICLAGAVL